MSAVDMVLFTFAGIYIFISILLFLGRSRMTKFWAKKALPAPPNTKVLLITAHPDDECLFFGPTLLTFLKAAPENVYLLCLSVGRSRSSTKYTVLHVLNTQFI